MKTEGALVVLGGPVEWGGGGGDGGQGGEGRDQKGSQHRQPQFVHLNRQ